MTVAVILSLATGGEFRPSLLLSLICGAAAGGGTLLSGNGRLAAVVLTLVIGLLNAFGVGPVQLGEGASIADAALAGVLAGAMTTFPIAKMLDGAPLGAMTRHEYEEAVIPVSYGLRLRVLYGNRACALLRDGFDQLEIAAGIASEPAGFFT